MRQKAWRQRLLELSVFGACLVPLSVLAWHTVTDNLGANPIKAITEQTGWYVLNTTGELTLRARTCSTWPSGRQRWQSQSSTVRVKAV